MSSGNGRQRIWCQTACFSGARVVKRIQDAPAEILRVGKRTVQRWEAAKTIPTSHSTPLNTSPCFSPSTLDASSPTDSASGNTLGKLRLAPLKTNDLLRSRMTSLGQQQTSPDASNKLMPLTWRAATS